MKKLILLLIGIPAIFLSSCSDNKKEDGKQGYVRLSPSHLTFTPEGGVDFFEFTGPNISFSLRNPEQWFDWEDVGKSIGEDGTATYRVKVIVDAWTSADREDKHERVGTITISGMEVKNTVMYIRQRAQ